MTGWPYMYGITPEAAKNGTASYYNDQDQIVMYGRPLTIPEIMRHFDQLPRPVREALYNAQHPWAPTWCLERIEVGFSVNQIISRLNEADTKRRRDRELELARQMG